VLENDRPLGFGLPMKREWSIASVTVTRNPGGRLSEHMDALLHQTRPLNEIIVIDNASTDGTVDALRRCYPQVTLLPLHTNTGVGAAYASSLTYAVGRKHDWIWLFDQDSVPAPTALQELLNALTSICEGGNEIGVLASLPVDPGSGTEHIGLLWRDRLLPIPAESAREPIFFADSVISSGSLIRREVIERVGLPRKDFFIDFVDHEYNLRIRKVGYRIAMVRASVLYHRLGEVYRVRNFPLGSFRTRSRQPTWRHYFMSRNEAFTIWHLFGNARSRAFLLTRFFRRAASIVWYDRDKLAKLHMHLAGFVDGLAGNLSKRPVSELRRREPTKRSEP
jgi:GT2 family glycosyltransferase